MKKTILFLVLLLVPLTVTGCMRQNPEEMFSTAKFEELQNNKAHAIELYEEIARKYPDHEYGRKAKERIAELRKQP